MDKNDKEVIYENVDIFKANWDSIYTLILDKLRRANPMTEVKDIMDHLNDAYNKYIDEHCLDKYDDIDSVLELYSSLETKFNSLDPYNYTDQAVMCYRILNALDYIMDTIDNNKEE